jgi:hypothetical protein
MLADTEGDLFDTINTISDLSKFIEVRGRTDISAQDEFNVHYTRQPEYRSWDLELQYKRSCPYTGYISFAVKNNTSEIQSGEQEQV